MAKRLQKAQGLLQFRKGQGDKKLSRAQTADSLRSEGGREKCLPILFCEKKLAAKQHIQCDPISLRKYVC